MRLGAFLGVFGALLLHAGFLLFGRLLFGGGGEEAVATQEVDLLAAEPEPEEEEEDDEPVEGEVSEELEAAPDEAPPDVSDVLRSLDLSPLAAAPELEAASLAAIEAALNGRGGAADFADALSFASGGRIGGTAEPGALGEELERAFSMAEIDQKPRAVFQAAPLFPAEMRGKKVEGLVTLVFVVDAAGKVTSPRVEKSSHPAFEKPALDALQQWKFEPAVKSGERVPCKMRVPIRFQPS